MIFLMMTGSASSDREFHHTPAETGRGTGRFPHLSTVGGCCPEKKRQAHFSRENHLQDSGQPILVRCFLTCIRTYQLFISPLFPPCCRFTPTCSAYAREAILSHGCGRGLRMALFRLLRCHPFGGSGYDPVP